MAFERFWLEVGADEIERVQVSGDSRSIQPAQNEVKPLQTIQALPHASQAFARLLQEVPGKAVAIFLDYDGTLSPLADQPEQAELAPAMRTTLRRLAVRCPVGIISGRDREDVERLVQLDSVIYAGCHGFDIMGSKRYRFRHEEGVHALPALRQAEVQLRRHLQGVEGVFLEQKKFSVAVHYRLTHSQNLPMVQEVIESILAHQPHLQKIEGLCVYELRPRVAWDKGAALWWILQALSGQRQREEVLPLYLGDDLTDEAALRVVQERGLGIVVNEGDRPTYAQYRLASPDEVKLFLDRLCDEVLDQHISRDWGEFQTHEPSVTDEGG
ncbi:MAG: trehalose-phosphatase [Nitrospirae bacterium]|nr:MAG: trehalose-phosphatase [Nitrospirota bacterium]